MNKITQIVAHIVKISKFENDEKKRSFIILTEKNVISAHKIGFKKISLNENLQPHFFEITNIFHTAINRYPAKSEKTAAVIL